MASDQADEPAVRHTTDSVVAADDRLSNVLPRDLLAHSPHSC